MFRFIFSIMASGMLVVLGGCSKASDTESSLMCHVGGTMRPVFEKLAEVYAQNTGRKVEINSAGSGELLANIELQAEGDVYVSHDPFMDIIMDRKLAADGWTIGEIYPVIIVQKGNPKNIRTLQDLARDDVELALTDFKLSTLGRMLPTIFSKAGMDLEKLNQQKNIVIHRSGSYVANLVQMKQVDAALVWEAVAVLRRDSVESIPVTQHLPVPYVDTVTSATGKRYKLTPVRVTICSLKCSEKPEITQEFIDFVLSDQGKQIMREYGFGWSESLCRQEYEQGLKR